MSTVWIVLGIAVAIALVVIVVVMSPKKPSCDPSGCRYGKNEFGGACIQGGVGPEYPLCCDGYTQTSHDCSGKNEADCDGACAWYQGTCVSSGDTCERS